MRMLLGRGFGEQLLWRWCVVGREPTLTSLQASTAPASDQSDTGAIVCSEAAHSTSSTERRCRCVLASFTAAHCVWAAPGGAFTACGRACKAIPMADHQQHGQQFQRPSLGSRSYRNCGPCLQSVQGTLCLPTSALMRCEARSQRALTCRDTLHQPNDWLSLSSP
jgi:hypothetical protein